MNRLQRMILAALFTAFTCIATMLIKIPTPTFGYIHIGDTMVLLSGIILGPGLGALAAGLGSALSDLFSGYLIWVPATFLIKALTAFVAGALYQKILARHVGGRARTAALVLGVIIGELLMVLGYFIFEVFVAAFGSGALTRTSLYAGILSSATGIPFNLVQGVTGIILSALLLPILVKIPILKRSAAVHNES